MNTTTEQPEALRLAETLAKHYLGLGRIDAEKAAAELRRLHAEATDLRRDLSIARAELALLRGRPVDVDAFNAATTLRDRLARALRSLLADTEGAARRIHARQVLADYDADRDASRRAYLADEYRSGLDAPPRN